MNVSMPEDGQGHITLSLASEPGNVQVSNKVHSRGDADLVMGAQQVMHSPGIWARLRAGTGISGDVSHHSKLTSPWHLSQVTLSSVQGSRQGT